MIFRGLHYACNRLRFAIGRRTTLRQYSTTDEFAKETLPHEISAFRHVAKRKNIIQRHPMPSFPCQVAREITQGPKGCGEMIERLFIATQEDIQSWNADALLPLSPLAGAVFRSNRKMISVVYNCYNELCDQFQLPGWNPEKVRNAVLCSPNAFPRCER